MLEDNNKDTDASHNKGPCFFLEGDQYLAEFGELPPID